MKVVGISKIEDFLHGHADVRGTLGAWLAEVEDAAWRTPQDIKNRYRHASFLEDNLVVFNIKGNSYRLLAKVSYNTGIVKIENIGTHAEYSKWNL